MSRLDAHARDGARALLLGQRWATLATVDAQGEPMASLVAFAPAPRAAALVLHLSTLAAHTRNALARPACALALGEPDDGRADPQTLVRLGLRGRMQPVAPQASAYAPLREAYLARLPEAAARFGFGDFHLLRLDLEEGQLVAGFARAFRLSRAELESLLVGEASGTGH